MNTVRWPDSIWERMIMWSNPFGPGSLCHGSGATWCGGQVIWEKAAAYSDIVLVKDEIVGVLYENGDNGSYERISFERVPLGYAFIK